MMAVLLLALWFLFALTGPAEAGPIAGLIAAGITAITSLGPIGQLILGVALRVGASLLQKAMSKDTERPVAGVKGSLRGGDQPLSFIIGTYATGGTLDYVGTWGTAGKTPNAYLTQVISLSDLPISAMSNIIWVNGEQCTIDWNADPTPQGYPVTQYRRSGVDYLWIKFQDGAQTEPDAFLSSTFASGDRPWQADMVGNGIAYAIVTARFNREVFTGGPQCKFVLQGIPLYDPRKDSTVGGSGTQRWHLPNTWEFSDNTKVMQYNVLRGLYYDGEWFYGGQGMLPFQLPLSNWMAAMNECDRMVAKAGGGTEKQFRSGAEIECGDEPLQVVKELDKSCSGRTAELGGIYKTTCGAPGLPVYVFTDEDIVITDAQEMDPFPGLEGTVNGVNAVYPEPAEGWADKEAPVLRRPAYEAADGGNRLLADVKYPFVFVGTQVQRLNRAMTEEARRFRRHNALLPPEAWLIEPLDTVTWTSARNGYAAKKFLMGAMDDLANVNQAVAIQEIDPTDYDWSSDYELPDSTGPTGPIRPPAQVIDGWEVHPATIRDSEGNDRRPAILVMAPDGLDDIRSIRVKVRLAGTTDIVFDSDAHAYDDPWQWILNGTFLPAQNYEVRCWLIPYSRRPTTPSAWLPVTTPNVKLTSEDVYVDVDLSGLDDIIGWTTEATRQIIEEVRSLIDATDEHAWAAYSDRQTLRRELVSTTDEITASYLEAIDVATGPTSAIAQKLSELEVKFGDYATVNSLNAVSLRVTDTETGITALGVSLSALEASLGNYATAASVSALSVRVTDTEDGVTALAERADQLYASMGGSTASINVAWKASATPAGYAARYGVTAAVAGDSYNRVAAFYLDVPSATNGQTRVVMQADQVIMTDGTNLRRPFVYTGGVLYLDDVRANSLSAISANAGTLTAGIIRSTDGKMVINLNNGTIVISS